MIITIDGPSGTGKSTVARKVAQKLGLTYFDTGAMYRAVTWGLLNQKIPLSDRAAVGQFLSSFEFEIREIDDTPHYLVNGTDVTEKIRSNEVNEIVSEVSALKEVRETLWKLQRSHAEKECAVFDGRDMGSVVLPEAPVKVYLDAAPEVRARRRLKEMREKLPEDAKHFDEEKMKEELIRRDTFDKSRPLAPLKCPKKALKIDTSLLTIDQVVDLIMTEYSKKARRLLPAWIHSKKMGFLYRCVVCLTWCIFKVFYRHQVYGIEHFIRQPVMIAPNHTSYMDPPIASISWPEAVHFLARETLFRSLFGKFIRALNSHPVRGDIGDISVFKTLLQLLKEGNQITLFPEGKRTDGELEEMKPGIGMLLMRSQTAIIPAYIYGASKVWGTNRKSPKLFGKTACVFGKPIRWEAFAHLEKKQAQQQISEHLREAILSLKAWYEAGAVGIPP